MLWKYVLWISDFLYNVLFLKNKKTSFKRKKIKETKKNIKSSVGSRKSANWPN